MSATSMTEMVKEFHLKMGQSIETTPEFRKVLLRWKLIDEEVAELEEALDERNLVDAADALGDIMYVTIGAALAWGIDIDRVFAEIHRSNMTKSASDKRADGKILKGPEYSPPDLSFIYA